MKIEPELTVQAYHDQYVTFSKAAALNTIARCTILVEAEQNLSEIDFEEFCSRIKLKRSSSTFRKFRKIGENADRLIPVADKLPDCWTSLYKLAGLRPDQFDSLVMSEQLHPSMTANDIKDVFAVASVAMEQYVVNVDITALSDGEKFAIYKEINEAADRYGAVVSGFPDDLIVEFESRQTGDVASTALAEAADEQW